MASSLPASAGDPRLGLVHLLLAGRGLLRRVEQRRRQPRAIIADRFDLGFDFPALLFRGIERAFDAVEFELAQTEILPWRLGRQAACGFRAAQRRLRREIMREPESQRGQRRASQNYAEKAHPPRRESPRRRLTA